MTLFGRTAPAPSDTPIPAWFRAYLVHGTAPAWDSEGFHDYFEMQFSAKEKRLQAWERHRNVLLAEWVAKHPGSRPAIWWELDAPEMSAEDRQRHGLEKWPGRIAEPRVQLSGDEVDVGPDVDEDGLPSGIGHVGIDPKTGQRVIKVPIIFESQAAYLRRHKLFLPGEEKRCPRSAFQPEAIEWDDDEDAA